MKDFVKYTLATLCGLFLAGIALFILGILSIAGMMTVESAAPSIKPQYFA
jgi:protease-4